MSVVPSVAYRPVVVAAPVVVARPVVVAAPIVVARPVPVYVAPRPAFGPGPFGPLESIDGNSPEWIEDGQVARDGNEVSLRLEEADRFERLRLIPWWDQELLLRSTVLVVGAGALGNEAIKNLALSGVGRLIIVDSDVIDPTNLPRSILFREADCGRMKAEVASKAAQEISPAIQTKTMSAMYCMMWGWEFFEVQISFWGVSTIVRLGCG